MSRQKTFWARLPGRKVRHLWHKSLWNWLYIQSDCGQIAGVDVPENSKDRKCKNCLRAIKT